MPLLALKTERFSTIVEKCGRPEALMLRNGSAQRVIAKMRDQHRAVTVPLGARAEAKFGIVGVLNKTRSVILAFPKSLKRFENTRITGIQWDLVKD